MYGTERRKKEVRTKEKKRNEPECKYIVNVFSKEEKHIYNLNVREDKEVSVSYIGVYIHFLAISCFLFVLHYFLCIFFNNFTPYLFTYACKTLPTS